MSGGARNRGFLGRGLSFPLQVNARGEIALSDGERDIGESIRIILSTQPGERVMRPTFGCRAHELLFEPRDVATETLLRQYVVEALTMWEPRIEILAVKVFTEDDLDGAIFAEVEYIVSATHNQRSIVYPFFLVGQE